MRIRFANIVDAAMVIPAFTDSARCVQAEIADLRKTVVMVIPALTRNVLNEVEVEEDHLILVNQYSRLSEAKESTKYF